MFFVQRGDEEDTRLFATCLDNASARCDELNAALRAARPDRYIGDEIQPAGDLRPRLDPWRVHGADETDLGKFLVAMGTWMPTSLFRR